MKNNYVTGENGFLLSMLLPHLELEDCIIHFGSVSSIEEFSKESTGKMVQDVENLLKLPHKNILFASSMGTLLRSDNPNQQMYNDAKSKCEELIIGSDKNYAILKIPRVYGRTRKKGLMKQIRENKIDNWDFEVSYLDIEDFVEQTKNVNINSDIIYYNNLRTNTIREIKDIYDNT